MACLRPPHEDARLEELAKRLRDGGLVAFPTETVYGLGANGLDEDAVHSIFTTKGRPLSDPVILHVPNAEGALKCWTLTDEEEVVFKALATFWPGPLSIIAKSAPGVPDIVSANTGFVACRCPNHPLALRLLEATGRPVAAPSANVFGHVSPTTADHVAVDFRNVDLPILDGGACGVGIESTVIKLDAANGCVTVLRPGGVTTAQLQERLAEHNLPVEVRQKTKESPVQAPGMMLKHYAPRCDTFLASVGALVSGVKSTELPRTPRTCIAVDVMGRLKGAAPWHTVIELCPSGKFSEAQTTLFAALRRAEEVAETIVDAWVVIADCPVSEFGADAEALLDRVYRAASGRRLRISDDKENLATQFFEFEAPLIESPKAHAA